MNYPVWELYTLGGGFWIAIIAVLHVFVAHFAIGGGLFLVLTEKKGYRENSQQILDYTKKHAKFFMLLTLVFGAVSGVGIWFAISLISPAATSRLIHTFVYFWAIEWVFFMAEIVAIFVYFYTFGKMERKKHLLVGWLYFIFAWLSLFMINGIIAFMLSPGAWLETGNVWHAFFNPTFWPALFFRTFIALMLAGLYGFVTSSWIKDPDFRETMIRYCAKWLLLPFVFLILSGLWYLSAVPEGAKAMILGRSPEIVPFFRAFIWLSVIIVLGGLLYSIRMPGSIKRPVAFVLLFIGLLYMGSFEWMREAGRRPFVIYEHMYSNSIPVEMEEQINEQGLLTLARWVENREITEANMNAAGREIFNLQCISCHSLDGPLNDIRPITAKYGLYGMDAALNGIGKIYDYMPRFMGTRQERLALARFIVEDIHARAISTPEVPRPAVIDFEIPPFDPETDEYVLLAWNNLGLKCITDCDDYWSMLPPGNTLYAQLVRRDAFPEIVLDDVVITYRVEQGFENPADHVSFWDNSRSLMGREISRNVGPTGLGMEGRFTLNDDLMTFVAGGIPVVPYADDGSINPYPFFYVEAWDQNTGELLAWTKAVAPVSAEMGCNTCHGGEWRVQGTMGIAAETASDVLKLHDKRNRTELMAGAEAGQPVLCQSCHADPLLNAEGDPELLNLPAAIHGFHANYLTDREGPETCNTCHPSHPDGYTDCKRGVHATTVKLDCTYCHGTLEDHALTLLKGEYEQGKTERAGKLMRHIEPRLVASLDEINPRTPWNQQPDCLTCHRDFEQPESHDVRAFNVWNEQVGELYRLRADDVGLMCQSCHGATHAEYPAVNKFGLDRDNVQPLQYQNEPYAIGANNNCAVCHIQEMDFEGHHPGILEGTRNKRD
ncbi:cytochrome ubiquinol oxidase subunit I [Desulfonatronovibrio hydrogenovorans]|uniref:cytochrome ubiquinol oxidase subunit I n=1 Tax=Desulfonatronovibrio hydrogenovorans TaxID=53245 RepID=UPI00048CC4D5|nr:cytochrome ubiquinol oxidase subunit I [Desulfonatronovibrio hydrogenovorans]